MKDFKSCLRGLKGFVKPQAGKIVVSCIIGIVRICASLAFVWICKALVDIATRESDASLWLHVGIMGGIILIQLLSNLVSNWWEGYINLTAANETRAQLFSHVMRSKWNGKDSFHSGDTVNRLEEDIRVITDLVCSRLPSCIVTILQLVAASAYLAFLAPSLLWVLLILMPVAVVGSKMFFKTIRSLTAKIRALDSSVQSHMQENLQNRVLVKILGSTRQVLEKLDSLQSDLKGQTVRRLGYNAGARGFMGFGFMAGYAAAFLWGIFGIRDGSVTFGMMTAFLQLVGQVQRPIADISRHIPAFIHALTSVERLMELSDEPLEAEGKPVHMESPAGVRVESISFAYPGQDKPVFKDFSYDFKPGSMTAVMGMTGAGKSTLTKLIIALLEPSEGKIVLYDGKNEAVSSPASRCNFMYVPQGGSLMSGTIRDNLMMADPEASEEMMKEALHLAVADFVTELPEGLDSVCSEKGSGLSEGQAQRIAIARAMLQKGGILIMDEATSALDMDTERLLLERISAHFSRKKTIIWITHRDAVSHFAGAVLKV